METPVAPRRRRRLGRWVAAALLLLLGAPPIYMAVRTSPRPEVEVPTPPEGRYRVWVVGWGYHTSILIEQPSGWRLGPPGQEDAPVVEFAWGDSAYYMESDHRPHVLARALLLPTASVVYVRGRSEAPTRRAGARTLLVREVGAEELRRLVRALEQSFARGPDGGRPPPHPAVPSYRGRFYPGRSYYIFWSDCNLWTVRQLERAGMADGAALVFLEQQVPGRLRGFRPVE